MNKAIFLTAVLSLSFGAYSAPKTANEKFFDEGTETNLSREQVQDILPWAQNTKALLVKLLATTSNLTYLDKNYALIQGIRQGALTSAPHNTELAMRYILNRANKIYKIMRKSPHANEPMAVDAQNRLLESSVAMAIRYYTSDMQALKQAQHGQSLRNITFQFAYEYQSFLESLSQFNFDPKTNYKIQYTRIGFFAWDLYRLKDNKSYANSILEIRRLTKTYSKYTPKKDQVAIKLTTRLNIEFKKIIAQLNQTVTFKTPLIEGKRLDGCKYFADQCSGEAAHSYCQINGFKQSISYNTEHLEEGITYTIGDRKICDTKENRCGAIKDLVCSYL